MILLLTDLLELRVEHFKLIEKIGLLLMLKSLSHFHSLVLDAVLAGNLLKEIALLHLLLVKIILELYDL